jgi:peptide methionine sulfoxide reductase MsrB
MNQIIKTHKPTMRNFRRDEEAVRELSPEQFRVTQRSGTECPGTGEYLHNEEPAIYFEVVSGEEFLDAGVETFAFTFG